MRLSFVLVAYEMGRELPRTLQALAPSYQLDGESVDYEVIVVDNGSREPLRAEDVHIPGLELRCLASSRPGPSPATAMNEGIAAARGDIVCLMIDGAHLLTPGVLRWTLRAFAAFPNPLVAVRYFYTGPGDQPDTVLKGYDQAQEDQLLQRIAWPEDGYRLFEIGAALRGMAPQVSWLNRMFESNCLALTREQALALGGLDEAFDLAGGGFVNLDFFKRACETPGVDLVELVGEGSFHQVHGGTTTNSQTQAREERLGAFRQQYEALRGHGKITTDVPLHFLGHLPSEDAKIHRYPQGRRSKP